MVPETAGDEVLNGTERNGEGKQTLLPVEPVIADNSFNVILVDGRAALHEGREIMVSIFQTPDNPSLVRKCRLGIRYNESGHEGMRFTANTAADTAETQADGTVRDFKGAGIISVDGKACLVSTGACELVELEVTDEAIVNFLDILSIGIAIESG